MADTSRASEGEIAEGIQSGENWTMRGGDSIERVWELGEESVGLSVFSPPFPGMYSYTDSPQDVGNSKGLDELVEHFSYLVPGLFRATVPGRSCAVHLTQQVAFKGTDGFSGLRDFRGRVISAFEAEGWIYYGEVCIEKDPQLKAVRTKDHGLMFKSLATDSAKMHMALADYMLQFRKPGENPEPIAAGISEKYGNPDGWITNEEWIEWASPIWHRASKAYPKGIRESNVLNVSAARCEEDERHLCPLQLDVIERSVKLWSNPGDLVLDPFAGVASVGHQALLLNRRFSGIELKRSYWDQGVKNLRSATEKAATGSLFAVEG